MSLDELAVADSYIVWCPGMHEILGDEDSLTEAVKTLAKVTGYKLETVYTEQNGDIWNVFAEERWREFNGAGRGEIGHVERVGVKP